VRERGLTCFAFILRQKKKVGEKERLGRLVLKMNRETEHEGKNKKE
jgi:hypothetical protein